MTREPSNQRLRLEQEWKSVHNAYQLTAERLKRLRIDYAIETDTSGRFKLAKNIETEEAELDRLENRLRQIERQFNNRIASIFHVTSRLLIRAISHLITWLLPFLIRRIQYLQNHKYIIAFVSTLLIILVLVLASNDFFGLFIPNLSFSTQEKEIRFSSGEHILVKKEAWVKEKNQPIDSANTQDINKLKLICKDNWHLKNNNLKEFVKMCSIDSEAKIYLNNKEAESTTNESKSSLIKLAVSVPISRDSGDGVFNSLEILRGVSLAQEEINKEGISFDRNKKAYLQISIIDDGSENRSTEEENAQKAANFLANNDSIVGVIGHFSSNATEAASRIYKKYGLVAISPTSTAVRGNSIWQFVPFLSNKLKLEPNIFRTSPDDSYNDLEVLVCVKMQKEKYVFETLNGKSLCY